MAHKANILKALGHPVRFEITTRLLRQPLNVGELQEITGAAQANVSQHLGILFNAGIVEAERQGTTKYYSIRKDRLGTVRTILGAL